VWAYDLLGRVTSKIQTVGAGGGAKSFTIAYGYAAGLLTSITYPSGRVVAVGHDLQGQATSLAVDATPILSGGLYFPFGPARQWTWANGEPFERLFDEDGRIAGVTLGPSTATYADLAQSFGYDALDRLTSASIAAGQALGFTYDANSNRTGTTVNGGSATTYSYPGSSHKLSSLSGATSRSFTYDAAGNLTLSAGVTYVYDGRGRLKQAGAATYLVNGLGQRVKKTAGTETYFAYDEAGRLIGEYDGTGSAIQEVVWLADTPVASVRPVAPGGFAVFYIWADHLNTPRVVSDTSNQVRWEWANANPFGAHLPNENPGGVGAFVFNLRFPGQYFDSETGLHYNYFRDYDPAIGRYVQSDPIGLRGGVNTFGYVTANPLAWVDSEGLAACTYSVSSHTLVCRPNGGGQAVQVGPGGVFSGQPGKCRNNPDCAQNASEGPIPMGDYKMNKDDRPGHEGFWRL
jgi:RHS repeat-associated protein